MIERDEAGATMTELGMGVVQSSALTSMGSPAAGAKPRSTRVMPKMLYYIAASSR